MGSIRIDEAAGGNITSLRDLFIHGLQRLYEAESLLAELWLNVSAAARLPQLRAAMQEQFTDSIGRGARLEVIFEQLDAEPQSAASEGLAGLMAEVNRTIDALADPPVKDAALIAAAQTLKHCQIASYGTSRSFAARLGYDEAAHTLQHSLEEEIHADQRLSQLAECLVHPEAARAAGTAKAAR